MHAGATVVQDFCNFPANMLLQLYKYSFRTVNTICGSHEQPETLQEVDRPMNPAKRELAKIVDEHELQLSDDARIALEKLVTNLAKEAKTLREQRAELERDKEILARCGQQADAETSRLSVENEALTQRLSGKTYAIARLESQIETLSDDLNRQAGQGYNVPMIRDFLDQLRSDLEGSIFENDNAGCFQRDAVEKDVKYMRRYGQMGGFFPMAIGSPGAVDHDRQGD